MPMTRPLACLTLAASLAMISPQDALTQEFGGGKEGVVSAFARTGLKVGSPLPHVSLFDDQGKPFNTKSLVGQYTVLVSGCLT